MRGMGYPTSKRDDFFIDAKFVERYHKMNMVLSIKGLREC